jgi:beta-ribofuranosylaminobenzene 5'-phosphate synthase
MKVTVQTPSRLHMGILDANGGLGRLYGSLGLAIRRPRLILEVSESESLIVEGPDRDRAKEAAETVLSRFNIQQRCNIKIKKTIPLHKGLGSGTQLRLAVARSIATLFNIKASTPELASIVGRGLVSGIGTAVFENGGFVVDGGILTRERVNWLPAPLIVRHHFPQTWFLIVAIPKVESGFSGTTEDNAFKSLPPSSPDMVGQMCRMLLMKMLPALVEQDIVSFGSALTELQRMTGESFSGVQGGRYAGNAVAETVEFLLKNGASGAGQSSWGPTVYGVVEGQATAETLSNHLRTYLSSSVGGDVYYTSCDNRGAEIRIAGDGR